MVEESLQEEILGVMIKSLKEKAWSPVLSVDGLVEEVQNQIEKADEDDIRYNLKRLDEDFYIDYTPAVGGNGTVELNDRGVDKYEKLSGTEVIPTEHCINILEILDDRERESPKNPQVHRKEVIEELNIDKDKIDIAVWYLDNSGHIQTHTSLGKPVWNSAKISRSGRQMLEQYS